MSVTSSLNLAAGSDISLPLRAQRCQAFELWFRSVATRLGARGPVASDPEVVSCWHDDQVVRLRWIDRRHSSRRLRPQDQRVCVIRDKKAALNVLVRPNGYMPLHTLVTGSGGQEIDSDRLRLTLEFLRALGPRYSGIFNRAGLTRDSFHAQVFYGILPIRTAMESPHAQSRWVRLSPNLHAAVVEDWPTSAIAVRGRNSAVVADVIASLTGRLRRTRLTYDLSFYYASEKFWGIVFARRWSSDDAWPTYSRQRKQLGKFGALELSGIIVSVTNKRAFRSFLVDSGELGRRYQKAVLDMAVVGAPSRLIRMLTQRR